MTDTSVSAPFSGRIDTTALEVGNYVTAGQTTLAKISNTDPVFVQFSIAEPEYLKLSGSHDNSGAASLDNLTVVLSDGSTYDLKGTVAEVNQRYQRQHRYHDCKGFIQKSCTSSVARHVCSRTGNCRHQKGCSLDSYACSC